MEVPPILLYGGVSYKYCCMEVPPILLYGGASYTVVWRCLLYCCMEVSPILLYGGASYTVVWRCLLYCCMEVSPINTVVWRCLLYSHVHMDINNSYKASPYNNIGHATMVALVMLSLVGPLLACAHGTAELFASPLKGMGVGFGTLDQVM